MSPFYSLGVFHGFTVFLSQVFYLSWPLTYKISWFGLFIGLSIFSSMYLLKVVLYRVTLWQQIIGAIMFTTNTYILMVVSGGQMGVALAYSVAPFVLARCIKIIQDSSFSFYNSMLAGLTLALQVMFDPRIAYLTFIAVGVYIIFLTLSFGFALKKIFSFFLSNVFFGLGISIGITVLLHAAWILPMLFLQSNPISQELTSVDGFRFFSFADFSHAFSLLHPNWPENIFGKTYFLKPEFLLLPIMAYSSLLFITAKNRTIIFFALLGLLGAFLAKGINPPFGEINQWLFVSIPGMNLFRDPTKFYLLVVLSYFVLIPFSIYSICVWLNSKFKSQSSKLQFKTQNYFFIILFLFFVGYWVFLIRPAIFGQLGGTFREREVPEEYIKLKDFLSRQPGFFRTLWIPRQHRFSFYSLTHVPVEAEPLFKKAKITDIINQLRKSGTEEYLSKLGIKYIIVPYDPRGEIFVKDRKYDAMEYKNTVAELEQIPWLSRVVGFEKIAVFKIKIDPKDLFWLEEKGTITYTADDLAHYSISAKIDSPQKLVFSENFHPEWQLVLNNKIIHAEKTAEGLNSFLLSEGNYQGEVVFSGDRYYVYGKIISLGTIALIVVFLFAIHRKKVYNT